MFSFRASVIKKKDRLSSPFYRERRKERGAKCPVRDCRAAFSIFTSQVPQEKRRTPLEW